MDSSGFANTSNRKRIRARVSSVDEYYDWIFENSVPGLPEKAAAEKLTPLEFMRRYGAFEIAKKVGTLYEQTVPPEELDDVREDRVRPGIYARA